jgi:transcriptional regulator with XRE-family HTH domain
MNVGEKLRYLRSVEGTLRGAGREMTQQAVCDAIADEQGIRISQSYLSQIERGLRPHLTNTTRQALARFFKVHPGYLVDDPAGFHTELISDVRSLEDNLDLWLESGAERFRNDPSVRHALLKLAAHPDTRRCLALFEAILETPGLVERLLAILRPDLAESGAGASPQGVRAGRKREPLRRQRGGSEGRPPVAKKRRVR